MALSLTQLKALVTAEGVKSSLDTQLYDSLTYDSEKNVDVACQSAARWCYTTLGTKGAPNRNYSADDLEVLTEAMTQRAIFELMLMSDFEADEYQQSSQDLIHTLLNITPNSDGYHVGASISHDHKSHVQRPYRPFTRRHY